MAGRIGTIIATESSPSTYCFSFVAEKNSSPKKGQYVEVKKKNRRILGYISEIRKSNRYFERAESVAEYEKLGGMSRHFPSDSWEYAVCEVRILGEISENGMERAFFPPSPGDVVETAENKILERFMGFSEGGLNIGKVQHHDVKTRVDMTRLLQKHMAILAMSGAGKSQLASVLLEELLDRNPAKGKIAVVVADIHGEYSGFSKDGRYSDKVKVIDGREISIPLRKVTSGMFLQWLPEIPAVQKEILDDVIKSLRKRKGPEYETNDLLEEIDNSESTKNESTKLALKRALKKIISFKLLTKNIEEPSLENDVIPGNMLVLDLSSIDSLSKKQIILSMVAGRLFGLRRKEKIPPFMLLVEEAHNFAGQGSRQKSIARGIVEKIAREGRKFGASLCLISQRPVNLSTTALSQCSTHIIMRVTNPNDLEHIQMSSEGIDSRVSKSISGLKVGNAIIVGDAVNYPLFMNVRRRKTAKYEKGLSLEKQAVRYEEKRKEKEKNVDAFI